MESKRRRKEHPQPASRHETVERLRRAGLRATVSRVAILEHLERDWSHPGVEDVWRALRSSHPSLSLSTVYATLQAFVREGLCVPVSAADGKLRVDGTVNCQEHDHARCRRCGEIFDVERMSPPPRPRARLPRGLRVLSVRVEYDVLCPSCASKGRAAGARR